MPLPAPQLSSLVAEAGYGPEEPVVVGVDRQGHGPVFVAQGTTRNGETLGTATVVYAASLSKQITAGCAAILVRAGLLDLETPLARWLPELPAWASTVRLRHLLHHTSGLSDGDVDAIVGTADRTTPAILSALGQVATLRDPPGVAHTYSNAGYVCLAAALERVAGEPLPALAEDRIFAPLAMRATRYWSGPAPAPPGAAPLASAHPAPLSLGDGGVWTTASDLLRWGRALNTDELSIAGVMETPGHLDDGTPIDYAGGTGIRYHMGFRVYRHGGGWPGLRALLLRVPERGATIAILALADDSERRVRLADRALDWLSELPQR